MSYTPGISRNDPVRKVEIPQLSREELLEASKNLHSRNYGKNFLYRAEQKPIDPRLPVEEKPIDTERTPDKIEEDAKKSMAVGTPGIFERVSNWISSWLSGDAPEEQVEDTESALSQNPEVAFPPRARRKEMQHFLTGLKAAVENQGEFISDEIDVDRLMQLLRLELRKHSERAGEIARELLVGERGRFDALQKKRLDEFDRLVEREKRGGLATLFDRGVGLLSLASMALKALSVGATPTMGAGLALLLVLSLDETTNHAASNKLLELLFNDRDTLDEWKQRRDTASMVLFLALSGVITLNLGAIKETAASAVGGMKAIASGAKAVSSHQVGVASAVLAENETLSTAVKAQVRERAKRIQSCNQQMHREIEAAAALETAFHRAIMAIPG